MTREDEPPSDRRSPKWLLQDDLNRSPLRSAVHPTRSATRSPQRGSRRCGVSTAGWRPRHQSRAIALSGRALRHAELLMTHAALPIPTGAAIVRWAIPLSSGAPRGVAPRSMQPEIAGTSRSSIPFFPTSPRRPVREAGLPPAAERLSSMVHAGDVPARCAGIRRTF